MLCDCNKCFDKCHIERSYEYVKRHRKLYGQQSLGENAPLDPATPSNDYLAASGSSPPPNSPSVSSRSQESLLLSSPLGVLDNLGRGRVSQSPRNLSNAAFSPLDSSSISDTQDRPSVPSVSNSLQSNSPGLPKPTFTPKFSPGSIGLCTPRYLLSQRKPGTIFIPDPSPIPPGRNITLKLPPWRQDYCIDNDGWLWDFNRYSPPPRPNAQFLGGDEERQYWANLLEDEDLPPAPALDHDLEADDEDLGNPDDVHYGIEPEPDDPDSEPEPDPNPEPQPQINQDEHDAMDIDIGDEDPPDEPEDDDAAPAFHGPANLRNYFVRTYLEAAYNGATKKNIHNTLRSTRLLLSTQAEQGLLEPELAEALVDFPLTMRSLEHRLGLNTERHLIIYMLCSSCGTLYTPDYIEDTQNPNCTHELEDGNICRTLLYTEVRLYGNVRKRKPIKQLPYYPVCKALESMLLRVGMHEAMQLWRGEGDEIDNGPPLSKHDWYATTDEHAPLTGVHNGWGWRTQVLGMTREYNPETGQYGDVAPDPPVALARSRFGISFSISIDGFRAFKKGPYTVNGVYILINNLPYYLRNRVENTIPAMIMPGPNKASAYAYDQMLQPLVNNLIELARGVHMRVYQVQFGQAQRELVHGHLHSMILDYVARIENCGHTALASEREFCLYCRMRHSFISIPEGFVFELS
ncbi:Transposase family tnp2 [Ceratobasidium sp. AG-Ba]|nr:Transposase family tnp2 [Ceratobasidium sp. AG-Ba]